MEKSVHCMIKTLLLDVDGVLVRGGPFSYHLERDYGITREQIGVFFKNAFPACLIGNADLKQELIPYLQQWGWQKSVDEFLQYWFVSEHTIDEPLVERVQQIRLQRIPCYLATNQEQYRTAYILNQMGFATLFDGIFSSNYVKSTKPQLAFFEHILHELSTISASDILFWDDSSANIAAAKQAGLQAELYKDFTDFQHKMGYYLS
jgi:putative hydrolase of the HAD superfamily